MPIELVREGWRDRYRQRALSEANGIIHEKTQEKHKNDLPDENKPEMRENNDDKNE